MNPMRAPHVPPRAPSSTTLRLASLALAAVLLAPPAAADDSFAGGEGVFVQAFDAVAHAQNALGNEFWLAYDMPAIPQPPCPGAVEVSFYLKNASGDTLNPITKPLGNGQLGIRWDAVSADFFGDAAAAAGASLPAQVELHVRVVCTVPPGTVVDNVVEVIDVFP